MASPTSIVIPVLNEGKNINKMIKLIRYFLSKMQHEIIFIDDNSNDNTKIILEKNRSNAGFSAPAHGLFLTDINYDWDKIK